MPSLVRTASIAAVALLASFAAASAQAACFFVYGSKNDLLYRSTISPIDLSRPISDGMRGRFAGGHFTMIPDETGCPDLLVSGVSQQFSAPGTGSRGLVDASPLFRDSRDTRVLDESGATSGGDTLSDPRRRSVVPARTR